MTRTTIALIALSTTLAGFARAEPAPTLWGPHIDIEAKPGSKRTLGEADLFLPLSQDARTLVFGNLRTRLDNKSSYEGNLGGGVRRMLDSGWNLGAYGYFDRRRSDTGNHFNQVTLGAEALGPDWDLRANAYVPQGDRVRTLSTTVTDGGPSTAALVGTVIQVTTPGSTTAVHEERSLGGYDLEAGWRLPLFDRIDRRQLRAYLGSYRFRDSVATVSGPRLRAEFALTDLPHLWRGAELLLGAEAQHDNVRGSQNFLSVRLRIPLGKTEERARQLTWQERRMTAPVMRDVDVVTNARTVSSTAATQVETATATAAGQAITVLDSTTTTGAALPAAIAAAGANSTVILSGTFNTSNALIALQPGQTVLGSTALTVATPSGRRATVTTPSTTVAANFTTTNVPGVGAVAVSMATGSTLSGVTVNAAFTGGWCLGCVTNGVVLDNADNVTLTNNTITFSSPWESTAGIRLRNGSTNATISGNTVSVSGAGGANKYGILLASGANSTTISNNSLSATDGTTNYAAYLAGATLLPGSTGNVFAAGGCGNGGGNTGSIVFTNSTTCP